MESHAPEAPRERVRRVVEAAHRLAARASGALVTELVQSTGLSRQGVVLALEEHLEPQPSEDELAALLASVRPAPRVTVVLSSNVFVGALRAIALAWASADDVDVRPSRREPAFARALVTEIGDPRVRLVPTLDVADVAEGDVHLYGSDETVERVRARLANGVRLVPHGTGLGLASITGAADVEPAAEALARDVGIFDQRGCLSPRLALVLGDLERARRFGEALDAALRRFAERVPRGVLSSSEKSDAQRYVDTMAFAYDVRTSADHVVGVVSSERPLVLPPTGRHVHVVACADEASARAYVTPLSPHVVNVGSDDLSVARSIAPPWARVSRLGWMQRPPLDGPVDRRGLADLREAVGCPIII